MIEVKNLTKRFEDKTVLDNISAVFETGKTNLIIGQSGSGKTVLMKNIVGLLEPTQGQILYDGRDFTAMTKKEKVMMRREMGMIFQGAALFDSCTRERAVSFGHVLQYDLPRASQKSPGVSGACQPFGRPQQIS